LGISARAKKLESQGYRAEKESLTISSTIWIQYTNAMDRRTDRQIDGHQATAKTALMHSIVR